MKIFFLILLIINIIFIPFILKIFFNSKRKFNKSIIKITLLVSSVMVIISCLTVVLSYFNYFWYGFYSNHIIYLITIMGLLILYYISSICNNYLNFSMVFLLFYSIILNAACYSDDERNILYKSNEFRIEKFDLQEKGFEYPYLIMKKGLFERKYKYVSDFDEFQTKIYVPLDYKTPKILIKNVEVIPYDDEYCVKLYFKFGKYLEADYILAK